MEPALQTRDFLTMQHIVFETIFPEVTGEWIEYTFVKFGSCFDKETI